MIMRKYLVTILGFMLVIAIFAAAQAATPVMTRFAGQYIGSNILERSYNVPMVRISGVPATSTNVIQMFLRTVIPDNLSTNAGATVSVDYLIGTLTFVGQTNYAANLDIAVDETLFLTNAAGTAITNSMIMYRD